MVIDGRGFFEDQQRRQMEQAKQLIESQTQAARPPVPWLTILGLGAAAVAAYYLWKQYDQTERLESFERPEPGPRIRELGRALGAFRGRRPRGLGRPPKSKYEFEPEVRLEGFGRCGRSKR